MMIRANGSMSIILLLALIGIGCSTQPTQTATPESEPKALATTTAASPATPTTLPGVGNFARVSPVLYRGQQPSAEGFIELKKLGVKTIVSLRYWHDDERLLKGSGLQYAHIPANPWHPEDEDVVAFLRIVEDPANQPVFVHCQHGADRTGYMVACYRLADEGWSKADALAEMPRFGFHPIFSDIPTYIQKLNVMTLRNMVKSDAPLAVKIKVDVVK